MVFPNKVYFFINMLGCLREEYSGRCQDTPRTHQQNAG